MWHAERLFEASVHASPICPWPGRGCCAFASRRGASKRPLEPSNRGAERGSMARSAEIYAAYLAFKQATTRRPGKASIGSPQTPLRRIPTWRDSSTNRVAHWPERPTPDRAGANIINPHLRINWLHGLSGVGRSGQCATRLVEESRQVGIRRSGVCGDPIEALPAAGSRLFEPPGRRRRSPRTGHRAPLRAPVRGSRGLFEAPLLDAKAQQPLPGQGQIGGRVDRFFEQPLGVPTSPRPAAAQPSFNSNWPRPPGTRPSIRRARAALVDSSARA